MGDFFYELKAFVEEVVQIEQGIKRSGFVCRVTDCRRSKGNQFVQGQ